MTYGFHFMTYEIHFMTEPISFFDEGEKIVVGSVLNDAGARWGERVDGSSGNYFQVKVEGIV